MLDFVVGKSHR